VVAVVLEICSRSYATLAEGGAQESAGVGRSSAGRIQELYVWREVVERDGIPLEFQTSNPKLM
jgi:hypothetical protein